MPPLNLTLWMLLAGSLTAFLAWGVVYLSGQIESRRKARLFDSSADLA
jgi:hypothetical protein